MSERETTSLIGSDKVDGTAVYGADQKKIGSIERLMIDKLSGKVAYAVISYGGFLGIGDDYYPTPWSNLKYDTNLGGVFGQSYQGPTGQCSEVCRQKRLAMVS